jgi:outer membrane receptor protein involved in Fe transport
LCAAHGAKRCEIYRRHPGLTGATKQAPTKDPSEEKMASNTTLIRAVKFALIAAGAYSVAATAQDTEVEQIVVTGTRITLPGVESASPIYSVSAQEISLQQSPSVEKIVRVLPASAPGDNGNVNNGTAGTSTINLRGLGSQRNLILMDGHRLVPYNIYGIVDTSIIPAPMVERLDIITGGASAVYGSDAISGALNFIMKKDFEGVEGGYTYTTSGKGDGNINEAYLVLGSNLADGRGNVTLGMTWAQRDGVQFGARQLGKLGIVSSDGSGYSQYKNHEPPAQPPDNCTGPNAVAAGGSSTTIPTRTGVFSGPTLGQFRNDGSLGSNCSVFNFNPYNYYQTPENHYGALAMGNFEINPHAEVYGRFIFSHTDVTQQVAPSGVFGSYFWTNLDNPLMANTARATIINTMNANLKPGGLTKLGTNWRDLNSNGVVDAADEINMQYRRRTVELGPRSTSYNNDAFQFLGGVKGDITDKWNYDVSYMYGQSNRTNVSAGYTNLAHIQDQVKTKDGVTCLGSSDPSCVPINLFGGYGSITPAAAAYARATALDKQFYEQLMIDGNVTGELYTLPWVDKPIGVTLGADYRSENGSDTPDECLKLAPASCLGGAGGNTLPVKGGYDVQEYYAEMIAPLAGGLPFLQSFDVELGYRWSDYSSTGSDSTYKYGFNWRPFDQLLVRVMEQRASRAPNVGELAAPNTTGLDNASYDPCSVKNAANITPELTALCVSTGMAPNQVGQVEDIVSGQINGFFGTDFNNLPKPEQADTFTAGVVWTPDMFDGAGFKNWIFSLDYYNIDVKDYIGTFTAQEILDGCYVGAIKANCDKILRVGGTLTAPGSGVQEYTTNLDYLKAEGLEFAFSFGVGLGGYGDLTFTGDWNHYLTSESRSSKLNPVIDCLGYYGVQCGNPTPKDRWIQRTTWNLGIFEASYLWRHYGSSSVEPTQKADTWGKFQKIDSYDYLDLYGGVTLYDNVKLSVGLDNVFDKSPPVLGNEISTTTYNGGNTLPAAFDVLGRVWHMGIDVKF